MRRTAQKLTSVTAARFVALPKHYGLEYGITYEWVGQCRHGVLEVFDVSLGPFDGAVACERFSRSSHHWTEADAHRGHAYRFAEASCGQGVGCDARRLIDMNAKVALIRISN